MIIDLILDRRDGDEYDSGVFYRNCFEYNDVFNGIASEIIKGFYYKSEPYIKDALKKYIIDNKYNPEICDYIDSVNWLER